MNKNNVIYLPRNQRTLRRKTKKQSTKNQWVSHDKNYAVCDPLGMAIRAMKEHGTWPEGLS